MDLRRVALFAMLSFVLYTLWTTWQHEYPTQMVSLSEKVHGQEQSSIPVTVIDDQTTTNDDIKTPSMMSDHAVSQPIHVQTDVLDLMIDRQQGNIIQANLQQYPQSTDEKNKPFSLLYQNNHQRYVADSELIHVLGGEVQPVDLHFTSEQTDYRMQKDQNKLVVTLQGHSDQLDVKKEFIFNAGDYLMTVQYHIRNHGEREWKGYMNTQLVRRDPQEDKSNMFHVGSFTGASYSQPGEHQYKKISFKDMSHSNLDVDAHGGWVAMQQHYFLTAWILGKNQTNKLYTRSTNQDYIIGSVSQALHVAPQKTEQISAQLYMGPEVTSVLKAIAPGLDLTVDYGWLWFLSALLFSLMKTIYSFLGNWGWSIIAVTVLIKLAFYRLSATSYKSMASMRHLQPKIAALRERYGDDKVKISQATMELYRQEKVNPLGGCLPIVIQIPVFIALYWVLLESVELRQAPFFGWITDLASSDPYHVLPVIMGVTMLIQQKLNPAPPDPMQAKIMMFLPVLFTGLFWNFPAGLVLYWIVNNSLSILQQWYITQKFSDNKTIKKITS